jgi:hypothetical protein
MFIGVFFLFVEDGTQACWVGIPNLIGQFTTKHHDSLLHGALRRNKSIKAKTLNIDGQKNLVT